MKSCAKLEASEAKSQEDSLADAFTKLCLDQSQVSPRNQYRRHRVFKRSPKKDLKEAVKDALGIGSLDAQFDKMIKSKPSVTKTLTKVHGDSECEVCLGLL